MTQQLISLPTRRRSWIETFFDTGLRAIFQHIGQILNASLVIAAGTFATRRADSLHLPWLFDATVAGYVMIGVGSLLLILNFIQGLYLVTRLKYRWTFMPLIVLFYIFLSLRAAQLFVAFRNS